MNDFFKFAGEHPILTVVLACIVLGTLVKLVPWSKSDDNSNDVDLD